MKKTIGTAILATTLTLGLFATEAAATNNEVQTQSIQSEKQEDSMKKQGLFAKIGNFFKGAFSDMKESAKAQHEVDKANFEAVKAESKANF